MLNSTICSTGLSGTTLGSSESFRKTNRGQNPGDTGENQVTVSTHLLSKEIHCVFTDVYCIPHYHLKAGAGRKSQQHLLFIYHQIKVVEEKIELFHLWTGKIESLLQLKYSKTAKVQKLSKRSRTHREVKYPETCPRYIPSYKITTDRNTSHVFNIQYSVWLKKERDVWSEKCNNLPL